MARYAKPTPTGREALRLVQDSEPQATNEQANREQMAKVCLALREALGEMDPTSLWHPVFARLESSLWQALH